MLVVMIEVSFEVSRYGTPGPKARSTPQLIEVVRGLAFNSSKEAVGGRTQDVNCERLKRVVFAP